MLQVVLLASSTVCASVPMLTFLATIWWLDRYDREPVWLLTATFLWGAVGSVVLAMGGSLLAAVLLGAGLAAFESTFSADLGWLRDASGPVLIAPWVEEPAKALFLLYVIFDRHFDNMTDGFVYGAAAGLGFGMTENFLYFASVSGDAATWGGTVFIRTFYSAVMHATSTAIVGAALGHARFRGGLALVLYGTFGLGLAMLVHGVWNGLITVAQLGGASELFWLDLVILPMEVLVTFAVFQLCLFEESATIRRELTEEADRGVLPAAHPPVLASWFRRLGRGWLQPGVDRRRYIETATALASRKHQIRLMGARASTFYHQEVERLREELQALLA